MDSLDSINCGEVLLLSNGNLLVSCTLCETEYIAIDEYAEHVKRNHCFSDYHEEFLEDFKHDIQELSPYQYCTTENNATLVSEDDFKMFDELEFIAPEPNNCRELEDFVVSLKNENINRTRDLNNFCQASELPTKFKQRKKPSGRKYKCQQCDFVTLYLSSMRCHIQRHDGIRPFSCSKCEKRFYTQTEVENHSRTHTRERPYLCTTCGHTCVTSFALWRHRKSCNNIRDKECTMCGAKFADQKSLRDHMTSHSDVRQFHCEICNASFKLKKALQSHIKIHENKREYKCKLCSACFNQAPSLSSHMKTKH